MAVIDRIGTALNLLLLASIGFMGYARAAFSQDRAGVVFAIVMLLMVSRISLHCIKKGDDAYIKSSLTFVLTKTCTLGVGYLMIQLAKNSGSYWHKWSNWDGGWYLNLAANGYPAYMGGGITSEHLVFSFFPLYPLMVKTLTFVTGSALLSGLTLSAVFNWLAIYFLYKLIKKEFTEDIAFKGIMLLSVFPTAFFLSAVYTESLFLFVSVAAFFFASDKKWSWAVFFAGLASGTRIIGCLVGATVICMYLQERWKARSISLVHLVPMCIGSIFGLLLYLVYQYRMTGDPMFFISVYNSDTGLKEWGRAISGPLYMLMKIPGSLPRTEYFLSGIFAVVFLIMSGIITCHRKYWHFGLYGILSILVPLSSGLEALWRYVLVLFPVFILLAIWSAQKRWCYEALLVGFSMMLGTMTGAFLLGFHVT